MAGEPWLDFQTPGGPTTLPAKDESAFQTWATVNKIPLSDDYDMRGFYSALMGMDPRAATGINPNDNMLHFPDVWKLPNHQSFSTESQFYDPNTMPNTPSWQGGQIGKTKGQSYSLVRPDDTIVVQEAPWLQPEGFAGFLGGK